MNGTEGAAGPGAAWRSIEAACRGLISPQTRAISIEGVARHFNVRVYHDGPFIHFAWTELEDAMAGETKEGRDPASVWLIEIRYDAPAAIPLLGTAVFVREDTQFREWADGDPCWGNR